MFCEGADARAVRYPCVRASRKGLPLHESSLQNPLGKNHPSHDCSLSPAVVVSPVPPVPVPMMVPIISPYQDRRIPIHHRRLSHEDRLWCHEDRRGDDSDREREPDANGHMHPRVGGERQDQGCDT